MHRSLIAALLFPLALLPTPALAQAAPDCHFVLGFAALQARLPREIGGCLDNERHNPANGDGIQQTTGGLLVWRRSDNWTAFTNGYWTWIDGPDGLVRRLNSQRFPWEGSPANAVPAANPGSSVQTPTESSGTSSVQGSTASSGVSETSSGVTNVQSSTAGAPSGSSAQATYHVCGGDTQTAQAIQQFIAGQNFGSRLVGLSDGCANLTITLLGSANTGGQSTSTQTVNNVSVRIVNGNGTTQVTISNA